MILVHIWPDEISYPSKVWVPSDVSSLLYLKVLSYLIEPCWLWRWEQIKTKEWIFRRCIVLHNVDGCEGIRRRTQVDFPFQRDFRHFSTILLRVVRSLELENSDFETNILILTRDFFWHTIFIRFVDRATPLEADFKFFKSWSLMSYSSQCNQFLLFDAQQILLTRFEKLRSRACSFELDFVLIQFVMWTELNLNLHEFLLL